MTEIEDSPRYIVNFTLPYVSAKYVYVYHFNLDCMSNVQSSDRDKNAGAIMDCSGAAM